MALVKHVEGIRRDLDHGTIVPYSLEMIEADYLPFDLNNQLALACRLGRPLQEIETMDIRQFTEWLAFFELEAN